MTQTRKHELFDDYSRALERLNEALAEDPSKSGVIIDGAIQRFEFTFELSWKLAKVILLDKGVDVTTPRDAIKAAFKAGLISDGDGWIDMLLDRNKTSHIYDENEAMEIYGKIKEKYARLFDSYKKNAMKQIDT